MANNSYFGQQVPQQSNQNYTYQPWGSGTSSQQPNQNFAGSSNQQQFQQYGNNFQRGNSNDGNWYPGNSYGPNQPQNMNQRGNYYQNRPHISNNNLNPSIGPDFDNAPPSSNYKYGHQNWTDSDYGNDYNFYSGGSNTYGSSESYSSQNPKYPGNKRGTFNERSNQTMFGNNNQTPYMRNNTNPIGSGKPNPFSNNNPNQFGNNNINQFNNKNSNQQNPFGKGNPYQFGNGNTNHFENKNPAFGTNSGNFHKVNHRQIHRKQQRQKKKMKKEEEGIKGDNPEDNKYYCDTCDRGFSQEYHYTEHCGYHKSFNVKLFQCSFTGCSFVAAPKLVNLHVQMQHKSGLAKKIWSVESQDDIEKWIEDRRQKFPTTVNIEKKKAILEEKKSRGEVLQTKYFGKMKGKNFDRQQNEHGDDACTGDKNVRGRRNRRRKKPMIEMGDAKVPKLNQSEGHISDQSEKEMIDKPFMTEEIKAMIKQRNTLHYRAKRTGKTEDWSQYRIVRAQCRRLTIIEKEKLGIPTQRAKRVKEKSEDGSAGNVETGDKSEASVHVEEKTTDRVNEDGKYSISKDEDDLEEHDNESWDWKRGRKRAPQRRRSEKTNKFGSDVRLSLKSTPSLLEKLLANDIRHERNVILQCVHHVVKNNFYGIGDSPSTNEIKKRSSCDMSVTNEISSQSECETGPSENKVRRIDYNCESASVNPLMQSSTNNTSSNEKAEQPSDYKTISNENKTETSNNTVTNENIEQSSDNNTVSNEKADQPGDDKTISNGNTDETSDNTLNNEIIELSSDDNIEQSREDNTVSNENVEQACEKSVSNRQNFPGNQGTETLLQNVHIFLNQNK